MKYIHLSIYIYYIFTYILFMFMFYRLLFSWVISVTLGECSVLCHFVWLPAVEKTVCQHSGLSDAPESSALHLRIGLGHSPLWRSAMVDEEGGCLWISLVCLWCAWSWAETPQPCWPWVLAGVGWLRRQEGKERVSVRVADPWPASGTPPRSWAFLSPG